MNFFKLEKKTQVRSLILVIAIAGNKSDLIQDKEFN